MRLKLTKKERTALLDEADNQGVTAGELVTGMVRRAMSLPGWSEIAETAALLQALADAERERDSARRWATLYEQEYSELKAQSDRTIAVAQRAASSHVSIGHILEADRVKRQILDLNPADEDFEKKRDALIRRRNELREIGATA